MAKKAEAESVGRRGGKNDQRHLLIVSVASEERPERVEECC